MEMCFVNLVEPGDAVVVCRNGVFGRRMTENVVRLGGRPVVVDDPWGRPVDPQKVEDAFRRHPEAKTLAFVHAETSTGVQSDAEALAGIARAHGALTIVDCVTSLAGTPVLTDRWGLDAVFAGSQKCLSCAPGLSPVTFSAAAVERARTRKVASSSWFLDLNQVIGYWGGANARTYHHTAPVNALYGLHESLVMLSEEGLENSWARHRANHERLKAGLEKLGLELFVEAPYRLPQLTAVAIPAGADDAGTRRRLLREFGIEIGAGLGDLAGRIWRIGLMGHSSRPENVDACLAALAVVMSQP
jgi:alanine-glyoxylate transaminase/serine-glyoxylate transaminase/serine-pyruvate transaminase